MGNKFSAFVVGGLVGAGVALLCAPRKGVETRALVAEKASTVFGQAKTVGDQAVERGQALYEDAVVQGQKAYDYAVAGTQAAYTDVTQRAGRSTRRRLIMYRALPRRLRRRQIP